jgi:hypothetical protein
MTYNSAKPKRGAPIPGNINAMIAGLFTDLLSNGGIQYAARQTAAVLAGMARRSGSPVFLLSLNDPPGNITSPSPGRIMNSKGLAGPSCGLFWPH